MATLNGVEFGIISKSKSISHDNIITDIPGSDTVVVDDLGYSTNPMVITGHVKNETEFDNFKEVYYSGGALTLIVNPDSGKQYTVYALRNVTELDGSRTYPLTDIIFNASFQMQTPYLESTLEVTRTKSITTQNQEWSADDDGANIATLGNVDAVPDIQVTGPIITMLLDSGYTEYASPSGQPRGLAWDGSNMWSSDYSSTLIYKHNSDMTVNASYAAAGSFTQGLAWDGANIWSCDYSTALIYKHNADMTVNASYAAAGDYPTGLTWDGTNMWSCDSDSGKIYKYNSAMVLIGTYDAPATAPTGLAWDGTNMWSCDSVSDKIYIHNSDMTVKATYDTPATTSRGLTWDGSHLWSSDSVSDKIYMHDMIESGYQTQISQTLKPKNYVLSNSEATVTINNPTVDATVPFTPISYWGQTINMRNVGLGILDSIQINLYTVTTSGDLTLTVYDKFGGSALGSKTLSISTSGVKTFTFDTPIAVIPDKECTDPDGSEMYFNLTSPALVGTLYKSNADTYPYGRLYQVDHTYGGVENDMYFVATGHSIKQVQQTFKPTTKGHLISVKLNMCTYLYGGSNPVTITIKEDVTTLGAGTVVLSGSIFADYTVDITPDSLNSLLLETDTSYIISITPPSDSANATGVLLSTQPTNVYVDGAVTLIEDGGTSRVQTHDIYMDIILRSFSNISGVQIYNTNDITVKCLVSNTILSYAVYRINADGTGTINYEDNFSTDRYLYAISGGAGLTHDTTDNELDIADDGYIYWIIDTKYPINGIPTLLSQINITAGTPTIQISTDAATWYDIDTAIVDDVETYYPLDNATSLSLAGKTLFYFRIDCVKAAAATCSVKSFELDINIHTIYAKNPKITKGGAANTFRCDQDSDSGMLCVISLIYPHRWWA